ncbi:MAG: sulfatase activating formylglycine-generating enzyme [Kiritimatiellia bacterium]|jgi:formylglycine-generating enzyme required for sulfatase activity
MWCVMNEFDKTIQSARQKRFIHYSLIGSLVAVGLLVYLSWLFLAKGYVLTVMPEEARASLAVNVGEGQGFYIGGVLYLLSTNAAVKVSANNFETESLRITETTDTTIVVTLTPSPGTLIGNTTPRHPETEWSLNNELLHIGETLEQRIPPGDHKIGIRHKFYQPIEENITVQRNQTQEQMWPLIPINGQLEINTSPVTASVMVSDRVIGNTPLTIDKPAGAYALTIIAEDYELIEESVEITYDNPQIQREYQLEPRKGLLSLSLSPAGGELLVEGIAMALTSNQTTFTVPIAANKKHRIRYQFSGYSAYSARVYVAPDENKKMTIALKKTFGTISITTSPAATIRRNGKVVGQTSFSQKLSTVPHQFEFSQAGYRSQTRQITPVTNKKTTIRIRLLNEFDARRKEGKPLYVSTLGINLKQVKPNSFTMGSPPNETGRQRNEFPLDVSFNRNIWVSQHEITEAQYAIFDSSKANTSLPVTDITWSDAVRYCNWLSEKEGLPAFYTIQNGRVRGFNAKSTGYRLLSEAEWEWLAKKSQRSTPTVYSWGNSERIPKRVGNIADKSLSASATFYFKNYSDGFTGKAPVGSFKVDRSGLYDVMGNVSEWVHDNYTNTPPTKTSVVNYMGATRGVGHIVKGANYTSGRLAELRGAYKSVSESSAPTIGFRIARYAKE